MTRKKSEKSLHKRGWMDGWHHTLKPYFGKSAGSLKKPLRGNNPQIKASGEKWNFFDPLWQHIRTLSIKQCSKPFYTRLQERLLNPQFSFQTFLLHANSSSRDGILKASPPKINKSEQNLENLRKSPWFPLYQFYEHERTWCIKHYLKPRYTH